MTKKKVFWISLVCLLVFVLLILSQTNDFCYTKPWCHQFWDTINMIGYLLYFSIPLFILSIITYFLREEVFRTWLHFTYWYIPIYIILVYLISGSSGGGFGMPNVFDEQTASFILSGLFLIISLIIIIIKSLILRKKPQNPQV